jgi:acetyl-CoA synthetase
MSYPYQIKSLDQYHQDHKKSAEDPEGFWGEIAENFQWRKKWDKVLDWNFTEPKIEWFKGGKLNPIILKKELGLLRMPVCIKEFARWRKC